MKIWMPNGRLDDFRATTKYCGFKTESERKPICPGDKIVYVCNGVIFGVFEAAENHEGKFVAWKEKMPFQVRLREIMISKKGLIASPMHYKTFLQTHVNGSPALWGLSEWEYDKIIQALQGGKTELMF